MLIQKVQDMLVQYLRIFIFLSTYQQLGINILQTARKKIKYNLHSDTLLQTFAFQQFIIASTYQTTHPTLHYMSIRTSKHTYLPNYLYESRVKCLL